MISKMYDLVLTKCIRGLNQFRACCNGKIIIGNSVHIMQHHNTLLLIILPILLYYSQLFFYYLHVVFLAWKKSWAKNENKILVEQSSNRIDLNDYHFCYRRTCHIFFPICFIANIRAVSASHSLKSVWWTVSLSKDAAFQLILTKTLWLRIGTQALSCIVDATKQTLAKSVHLGNCVHWSELFL